jgi:hypothetical protein
MTGLSATLVYVGIGSGLAVGVALLTVAILFLRTARRYVDLAEERLELLRESEALLVKVVRQQGQVSEEGRQRVPERSERIPEVVGHPLGQRTGDDCRATSHRRKRRIGPCGKRRVGASRSSRQKPESRGGRGHRRLRPGCGGVAAQGRCTASRSQGAASGRRRDPTRPNGSVANFFQRKYDLYLEQYERHVRLAERIHRMRDEAQESPRTLKRGNGRTSWVARTTP